MLNICFTADHELFFGKNYVSEEETVVRPTYSLMKVLEEYNIPLCLMTDVCSINRYRELNIDSPYVSIVEKQLSDTIKRGHDVQLHIHPHWLKSDYIDGQWHFNYSDFRLHSFGFKDDCKCNGRKIIADSKSYLVNLLKPVDANYDCIAFRAGGWCLQPEKEFLQALAAEGILIDTTVYYGGYMNQAGHFFDFRKIPDKPNWWIDPKKGLEYEANKEKGHLLEVAIGSYAFLPMIGLKKLMFKPYRARLKFRASRERGCSVHVLQKKNMLAKMFSKVHNFLTQPIVFSFDSACYEVMMHLTTYYLKRFDCKNQEVFVSIIGHPKALTDVYLNEIRKYCAKVTTDYSHLIKFIRLRDIPKYIIAAIACCMLDLGVIL